MSGVSNKIQFHFLFLLCVAFLVSCTKEKKGEDLLATEKIVFAGESDIQQIQTLLSEKKGSLNYVDQIKIDSIAKKSKWGRTAIFNSNNESIFIVPQSELETKPGELTYNLVFLRSSKGFHFVSLYRINNKGKSGISNIDLIRHEIFNKKHTYTADVTTFTPSGYVAYEYSYVNGAIRSKSRISKRFEGGLSGRASTCTAWYWVTFYPDGSQYWELLGVYCEGDVCQTTRSIASRGSDTFKIECGGGGGGGYYSEEQLLAEFDRRIIDSLTHECMRNVLNGLKGLNDGKVGNIIKVFSGDLPDYNWKVAEGNANGNVAITDPYWISGAPVTTIFDFSKMSNFSDLAVARTMIHEAIHAYITNYFGADTTAFSKSYPQLFDDYITSKYPTLGQAQHEEMGKNMVNDIAISLSQYGQSKGYNLSIDIYKDIAWGGLYGNSNQTSVAAFNSLLPYERERIRYRNAAENSSTSNQEAVLAGIKACL